MCVWPWAYNAQVCRPWLDIGVPPRASSSSFIRQLTELTTACSSLSFETLLDWRPELYAVFSDTVTIWPTSPQMLMMRVERHIHNHVSFACVCVRVCVHVCMCVCVCVYVHVGPYL